MPHLTNRLPLVNVEVGHDTTEDSNDAELTGV
jgi:hypothetical protein